MLSFLELLSVLCSSGAPCEPRSPPGLYEEDSEHGINEVRQIAYHLCCVGDRSMFKNDHHDGFIS
jgi:hypothetical protein